MGNDKHSILDEHACGICNCTTEATRCNCVHQYPRVLCMIAISRGSYNDSLITTSVDFPIDTFKPKEYSLLQDDADDIANFPDGADDIT